MMMVSWAKECEIEKREKAKKECDRCFNLHPPLRNIIEGFSPEKYNIGHQYEDTISREMSQLAEKLSLISRNCQKISKQLKSESELVEHGTKTSEDKLNQWREGILKNILLPLDPKITFIESFNLHYESSPLHKTWDYLEGQERVAFLTILEKLQYKYQEYGWGLVSMVNRDINNLAIPHEYFGSHISRKYLLIEL